LSGPVFAFLSWITERKGNNKWFQSIPEAEANKMNLAKAVMIPNDINNIL